MSRWWERSLRIIIHFAPWFCCTRATNVGTVKNVTIIGVQSDPQNPDLTRDGGVSVLLNGQVLWLYDDTSYLSKSGELLDFTSNSVALLSDFSNVTTLRNFNFGTKVNFGDYRSRGWIPFLPDEQEYNQKVTDGSRLAIWPGANPLAVSPVLAYLWAPVIKVSNVVVPHQKQTQQIYEYQYSTLVTIEYRRSGPVATRLINKLFESKNKSAIPYGCFSSIIGRSRECCDNQSKICRRRSIYLLGASNGGLQLARVSYQDLSKSESAYEFWQPGSCNFSFAREMAGIASSEKFYLSGSFSSGSVFYSSFFKTFLMVYMNADVDSTFYVRYLNLESPSCTVNHTGLYKGGVSREFITADDAEAIIHYMWSEPQVLFITRSSKDRSVSYSYAGMAHPAFFNQHYYQDWMYSNGGIDSRLESPWIGGEIMPKANDVHDGQYLMISWTTSGKNGYDIFMAKVEFETLQSSPAAMERRIGCAPAFFIALWLLLILSRIY